MPGALALAGGLLPRLGWLGSRPHHTFLMAAALSQKAELAAFLTINHLFMHDKKDI